MVSRLKKAKFPVKAISAERRSERAHPAPGRTLRPWSTSEPTRATGRHTRPRVLAMAAFHSGRPAQSDCASSDRGSTASHSLKGIQVGTEPIEVTRQQFSMAPAVQFFPDAFSNGSQAHSRAQGRWPE